MLVKRKILYTRHPFDESIWLPIKEEWRAIYLGTNIDLSLMLSLVEPYLRFWVLRLRRSSMDELLLSLVSYFRNPERALKVIRRLVRRSELGLSDLQYLMIEVLRSKKRIYSKLTPRQAAFFLHRFFLFKLKDLIRSNMASMPSQDDIRQALYPTPYTEPVHPTIFPITPQIELYLNRTEEELASLFSTYEVDVGRTKKQLFLKLRRQIKGL